MTTLYSLSSTDPAFNLALEELLARQATEPVFMLWQNVPSVIVGCHQNTAAEIDEDFVASRGIQVVRRITGGGASSPLWAQIKADVTGKTLRTLREAETACLGAASFAAVGVGACSSIPAAARAFAATDRTFTPSGADYGAAYAAFARLDNLLNNPA